MNVALLTPSEMAPEAVALADALRGAGVRLTDLVALTPPPLSRRGLRARLRPLVRALRGRAAPGTIPASRYARDRGLRCWRVSAANDPRTREVLSRLGADVVVARGAGILRRILLDLPGTVFVNAHAGRLPEFGGMNVAEWAVWCDRPIWGTIHRIDAGIDTGDILLERPLDLGRPATIDELRAAAGRLVWEMLPEALRGLAEGKLAFRAQPADRPRTQWFRMHPLLRTQVERKLREGTFFAIQEAELRSVPGSAASPR